MATKGSRIKNCSKPILEMVGISSFGRTVVRSYVHSDKSNRNPFQNSFQKDTNDN